MIYFAVACRGTRVKIGFSCAPRIRVSDIDHLSPVPVRLLATCRGYAADETRLHKRFAAFHVRGEWFRFEGALREYVFALPGVRRVR